jgi:hypothetical protein
MVSGGMQQAQAVQQSTLPKINANFPFSRRHFVPSFVREAGRCQARTNAPPRQQISCNLRTPSCPAPSILWSPKPLHGILRCNIWPKILQPQHGEMAE